MPSSTMSCSSTPQKYLFYNNLSKRSRPPRQKIFSSTKNLLLDKLNELF